ncbi:MAG TPA: hypothetical protein VFS52_22020 [Steroidobacteraceae bacterium]|jgi:hypothetical protein|nr:hypothetical protein [Steroidobacteraceae bacterium]
MSTNHGDDKKSVRSLDQLAQDIPPPRDLWPGIAAAIEKDANAKGARRRDPGTNPVTRLQWVALAAVIAALAVGVWVGRNVIPVGGSPSQVAEIGGAEDVITAAYVKDPRYLRDRAELVRSLDEKMKTLPPETQRKVTASLETIRKSIADIQTALGKDPGNALLQELLVNSYQDEMRVLTAVQAANGSEI